MSNKGHKHEQAKATDVPGPAEEAQEAGTEAESSEAAEAPAEETPTKEALTEESAGPDDRVAELEAEVADLKDKLLRAMAETENVRRRAERDKQDAMKYGVTNFAREMLTVADNLQRALDAVDQSIREENEAVANLCTGIEMTEREMHAAFDRLGIKPVEAEGQRLDPHRHEAMYEVEDPSKPAGTVIHVVQPGYTLHDRLLRPAKVGVAKGGPKAPPAGGEGGEEPQAGKTSGGSPYEKQGGEAGSNLDENL